MPLPIRTAWFAVALLWPVALLNYLDRQLLAAMKFSVMADIADVGTEENWGKMLAQFKWVYAVLSPFGGYIADRFSRRFVVAASLFAWSAVTWWTGHVETYSGLLWARTFMGVSEAFYIPAALALIADYHTGATRSRAVGVHQTAIYFGVILGGFGGYAADAPELGWRTTFAVIGLVGIAYALPLVVLLKDAPRHAAEPADRPGPGVALVELVRNPSFILLVLVFTLPAIAGWVVRDWMPAILKDRFALGQGAAGVNATLFVNLAALAGAFAGGWAADRAARRATRGRVYVSAVGIALLIPALFGIGHAPTLGVAVAFLILFGLGWGVFDANNMPILAQIVRPELRATGYGVMNLVSISCGGFADWGFGALRDARVPLDLIFGAFAGTAVLSVVLVLLVRPRRDVLR